MRPKVIMHTQVSLDGCIHGFENPAAYYAAAAKIDADMILFGSNTVVEALAQYPDDEEGFRIPPADASDARPWGVIPDSRGRVRKFRALMGMGYLKGVVALVSAATPKEYLDYLEKRGVDAVMAGDDHVDCAAAFEELNRRYGCRVLRTDSGGTLTSALLNRGLVDEISLVLSPCLVGAASDTVFKNLSIRENVRLELTGTEVIEGGYLCVKYSVPHPAGG